MVKDNVIKRKSYAFALRTIDLYKYLTEQKSEYILSKQVLRSGSAIGAMVSESEYAESPLDFIHKLSIALKEANETMYWLNLLKDGKYIYVTEYNSMVKDNEELIKLLISIIKTTKSQHRK